MQTDQQGMPMSAAQRPNKSRFLAALRRKEGDRVPNWEFAVMQRNTEAILGLQTVENVRERYRAGNTVWPPRSEDERDDRSALASYSCYLPAPEYRQFLEKTGQDAVICTLSWKPKSRKVEAKGVIARGQDGFIANRSELHKLPTPPSVDEMMAPLDYYLDAFSGTEIGVGVVLRSVFSNTYETLGMENFMLKTYDDPELIEILFDRFLEYSLELVKACLDRKIDFFALDDDICDNNGFLVNPHFLRNQWMPRTKQILDPVVSADIPIIYHCCGNIEPVIPLALELGVSAMHPIQTNCNDIYAYKREYGSDLCLVGNIDLAGVLVFGTPEEVRQETIKRIETLGPGGGYIVASSHSITDDVPPANYQAMIETTWECGGY
jgi:uroporphyrinogen-III decarboxylase